MSKTKIFVSWILFISMYVSLLAPFAAFGQKISGKPINQKNMDNVPNGFSFRLSEGEEGAETRVKPTPAATDPLSEGETSNLLKRIPEIKPEQDDKTDFAKRIGTLPPPKTGTKIPVKFPSDEDRALPTTDGAKTALEVIRFSPEGEVNLAPDLSVTFSQPMVAVTSQEEAAQTVPVQFSPPAEGKWRWLGTKTLMFDTTTRFRMATKYIARVPAGTKSATGQALQKDVTWTFTTPPPKVEQMIPANQTTRRDAVMFVSFDQQINPAEVLKTITVSGKGKKLPIRLATEDEIKQDPSVPYYVSQAQPNRWLAFRALNAEGGTVDALPADSPITVSIDKGTASAEGPLKTEKAQAYSFRTFGAMKYISTLVVIKIKKIARRLTNGICNLAIRSTQANLSNRWLKLNPRSKV